MSLFFLRDKCNLIFVVMVCNLRIVIVYFCRHENKCLKSMTKKPRDFTKRESYEALQKRVIDRLNPVDLMIHIAEGHVPEGFTKDFKPFIPTHQQRYSAMEKLLAKTMPDLKGVEVQGAIDNNVSGELTVTVKKLTK